MVECMEAWIVADADELANYYGQDFAKKALTKRDNVDDEPKKELLASLVQATKQTQKGEYAKIGHASQLLSRVRPSIVAKRSNSFREFTSWLDSTIAQKAP